MRSQFVFLTVALLLTVSLCHAAQPDVWLSTYTSPGCKGVSAEMWALFTRGVCENPNQAGFSGRLVQCPSGAFNGSCATVKTFAGSNCSANAPGVTSTLPCGQCTYLRDFGIVKLACASGNATINYKCDMLCNKCNASLKLPTTSKCYGVDPKVQVVQIETKCSKKFVTVGSYYQLNQSFKGTSCKPDKSNVGGPVTEYYAEGVCAFSSPDDAGFTLTCTPPKQGPPGSTVYAYKYATADCSGKPVRLASQEPAKTCLPKSTTGTYYTCPAQVFNGTCVYLSVWNSDSTSPCTAAANVNWTSMCGVCMSDPQVDIGSWIYDCDATKQTASRRDQCDPKCIKCNRTVTFSKSKCSKDPYDNTTQKIARVGKCTTKFVQQDLYPVISNGARPSCAPDGKKIGAKQTAWWEDGICQEGTRWTCTPLQVV